MQGAGKNTGDMEKIVGLSKTVSTPAAEFQRLALAVAISTCSAGLANTPTARVWLDSVLEVCTPSSWLEGRELVDSRISEAADGLHILQEAPNSMFKGYWLHDCCIKTVCMCCAAGLNLSARTITWRSWSCGQLL